MSHIGERARAHARQPLRLASVMTLVVAGALCEGAAADRLDPLDAREREKARATALLALERGARTQALVARAQAPLEDTVEVLLTERHLADKHAEPGPRSADVYLYDYASDTLRRVVVDLDSARVLAVSEMQGVQLPLTRTEIARALDVLLADHVARRAIDQEYSRITGQLLAGPQDLSVKAFAFLADSKPEGLNAAARRCGAHRCAQLLLSVGDVVLDVSPIVDLSSARVAQNLFN